MKKSWSEKLNCDKSYLIKILDKDFSDMKEGQNMLIATPKIIDKYITLGKKGSLHSRRLAISRLRQNSAVTKLFEILAPRYKKRNGGYSRVLKAGFRYGDAAPLAVIELIDRDISAKGAKDKELEEIRDDKPQE